MTGRSDLTIEQAVAMSRRRHTIIARKPGLVIRRGPPNPSNVYRMDYTLVGESVKERDEALARMFERIVAQEALEIMHGTGWCKVWSHNSAEFGCIDAVGPDRFRLPYYQDMMMFFQQFHSATDLVYGEIGRRTAIALTQSKGLYG